MIKIRYAVCAWLGFAVVAGTILTNIPWGDSEGFHGTGFPFANVYWDTSPMTDRLIDFPNPIAIFLNIGTAAAFGLFLLIPIWWTVMRARKQRQNKSTHATG